MWYVFVFRFFSNSHKVVGTHFVRSCSDGDAFAILEESSDTLGSYLSRWAIEMFIFASHTIAPLGGVLFENWQDLGSASDSPKNWERRCDGAVGVQRSCQDKQCSSPSSNRHEPDAQTLIIWYCLQGRVYTMCMFGLAGALWQVNVSSSASHPPVNDYPSKEWKIWPANRELGRFTCYWGPQWNKAEESRRVWGGWWVSDTARRWRGNVLSPLSESFSCWQTSSWPFPSQTMNLLYFPAPSSFPRAVRVVYACVDALQVCVCVLFCVCPNANEQMSTLRDQQPVVPFFIAHVT